MRNIDSKWFFTELPTICKHCTFFVKGDLIVLLPLVVGIFLTSLISLKFMHILLGSYIAVRYLGEMIYWLLQQFSDRSYRPGDFGLSKLDNNAIYILYQTIATAWVMVGIALVVYALLYM
jgi:hypothetical protein